MISIIVAVAQNGVIGDRNALLWHIREDLQHFKALTTGHPVVMGRKTYESLGRPPGVGGPNPYNPLGPPRPNRRNVVVTRQETTFEGCETVHSLGEALALFPAEEEVFIIGGAQIYAEALPLADRFHLTRVEHSYEGETRFPEWDASQWRLVESEAFPHGERYPYPFVFETYERR